MDWQLRQEEEAVVQGWPSWGEVSIRVYNGIDWRLEQENMAVVERWPLWGRLQ